MSEQSIAMVGLVDEHMGVAAWNADGTGPEPHVVGRSFDTPLGIITHHVYSASPDFGDIDPDSPGALRGSSITSGFEGVSSALDDAGLSITDLTLSMPLTTEVPGEFHHGEDHLERRTMTTDGPTMIRLAGETMLQLPIERWHATIDWNVARFEDSVHITTSYPVQPVDVSGGSSSTIRRVASALLDDVGARAVVLRMTDVVIRFEKTFSGNGRTEGLFGDIMNADLRVVGEG